MTNTNTDINPSNEAVNDIAKTAIEPHNFWCICLSFLNDPNYLVCPASFLHELYPLNCDDIELPITLTNLQLFLLALNTNPYVINALQHFTLEEKYIGDYCSSGDQFLDLKMFGRDPYVNIKALKESFALQPFQDGVNVLQILSKNPRVNALFDIIMAKFPEGDSKPNEGLRLLLKLALKNENSESSDKPSNKPLIIISSDDIRKLLKRQNNKVSTERKLAKLLQQYIQKNNTNFKAELTIPLVADALCDFLEESELEGSENERKSRLEKIKKDIKGIFAPGTSGRDSIEKEKYKKESLKKLDELLRSREFFKFICDNFVTI